MDVLKTNVMVRLPSRPECPTLIYTNQLCPCTKIILESTKWKEDKEYASLFPSTAIKANQAYLGKRISLYIEKKTKQTSK